MRLLMTTDTQGGMWTYAVDLARALGAHGVEVVLATMGARLTPDQAHTAGTVPLLRVMESTFRLDWMAGAWEEAAKSGDWLLELEQAFKPDIVHLNGCVHGALPWRAPSLVVGHSCMLSWWRAVKKHATPAEWQRYLEGSRGVLRAAALVVAPTRVTLNALKFYYGPFRHSRVIHHGRDPRMFRASDKEPFVFASGRLWDEAKNIAALNRVAPRLAWPVYVAGEERHPGGDEAPNSGVRGTGRLSSEAVSDWMGRAAVYAMPARYEPFGMSVLEAGLSGCALVLGDIPSLREIWDDAAVFVPHHDDAALAATLRGLIDNRGRREALGHRAMTRAMLYTSERCGAAYLQAYEAVLAARQRAVAEAPVAQNR